jgi:hypothetical protein
MSTSSLYPTHTIICKVSQSSSTFQTQIQPQRSRRFSKASKIKVPTEYPFEHGEVINCTLDGVSKHPIITRIKASFLTQLLERRETAQRFHHEANGDFKTVIEFNG